MRTIGILLLCILGAALLSSITANNANGPDDCCFKFYPRRVNKTLVLSYYMTDDRCPKYGVILVTQRRRHICVDSTRSWVQDIMTFVDERTF